MSEISISFFCEEWKMTREKASMLNTVIAIVFGSLCALSFGAAADWKIFGMTVFDLFNFTTANLLMPVCGIVFAIFAGWFMDKKLVRTYKSIVFTLGYIAPLAILSIFLYQLLG